MSKPLEGASGKTRALEVTELLVPQPIVVVNVSPAYLFRKVGSEEGAGYERRPPRLRAITYPRDSEDNSLRSPSLLAIGTDQSRACSCRNRAVPVHGGAKAIEP
jgi:hypothetical protein